MSRLKKIGLVLAFVVITALAAIFALESWYKDFGPTQSRLLGRWICSGTVRWEGNSMINESCLVRNADGSNSMFHIDWNANNELAVVTNSVVNVIGIGEYQFVPPWSIDPHGAIVEVQMNFPTHIANGFTLEDGNYIVEMRNINEMEIHLEDDTQGYRMHLTRQFDKFDLSVIAAYLFGL